MKNLFVLTIVILFSSCASTTQLAKFTSNKNLLSNQARIYILRPSIIGGSVKMKVFSNDKLIGKTGPKSYLCWDVNEGENIIRSNSENKDYFTVNAKGGKTYYIKQTPRVGWVIARVSLEQIEESEGILILEKLKKPKLKYTE